MDPTFARFNASISFDKRLFAEDIAGSIAHVTMLGTQGIIPSRMPAPLKRVLTEVLIDIQRGRLEFREELEDVHINVEEALKEKIGEVAGRLHTARSRNDQVALDLRLYLRDRNELVRADLLALMAAADSQERREYRPDHARLHPPAAGAAGTSLASPHGLFRDVSARLDPLHGYIETN